MYRVVPIDKALIITGSKEPKVIVSGGAFVIPIIRKADTFDLCMITVTASKDEILTATAVPIVADWTAQIRPDVKDEEKLKNCNPFFLKNVVKMELSKMSNSPLWVQLEMLLLP